MFGLLLLLLSQVFFLLGRAQVARKDRRIPHVKKKRADRDSLLKKRILYDIMITELHKAVITVIHGGPSWANDSSASS